jgi:hypothetical protein
MTCYYRHIAAVTLMLLLTGCAHHVPSSEAQGSAQRPVGAQLSKSQAIQIAKRAAQRIEVDLTQYAEPTAMYRASDPKLFSIHVVEGPREPLPGDHVWVVDFGWGRNSNYPGGDLSVYVDDKTGRACFSPSM